MAQFSELYSSALHYELGTDDSTRLFTDARRKACVNDGLLAFADLTECFVRESTISCSRGTGEYDLLSTVNIPGGDYIRLAQPLPEMQYRFDTASTVTFLTGANLPRTDIAWLNEFQSGWRASTGDQPRYWYEQIDGGRRLFGLFPPPAFNSSGLAKVVLKYVAQPRVMTSDTDVPFALASTGTGGSTGIRNDLVPYHQALVHFAAHKLEKLRVNDQASQMQLQTFLGYVQRFIQALRPKGGQFMKPARSYFAESHRRREAGGGPIDKNSYPWIY